MIKKIKDTYTNDGIGTLSKKGKAFLTRKVFLLLPEPMKVLFARKIGRFKSHDIERVVDYSFNVLGLTLRPLQIREEFISLLKLFKKIDPRVVVEIGTAKGGSLLCFCKLAAEDATLVSIDLPNGQFGGGYPEWKAPIFHLFAQTGQELYLLREDSHRAETLDKVVKTLNGRKVDFLFIDGDHEYEGVLKDFEMYRTLVRTGGVIAFHDVAPNGTEELAGGVPRFWSEVKKKYEYEEYIQDEEQDGYGIGCLFVNAPSEEV